MGSDDDRTRRVNGLQPPYHYLQIATWVLFPLILVHYFAYLMPLLWRNIADQVIVTFLFCFLCIGAITAGYLTCATDPADSALLKAAGTTPPPTSLCGCCNTVESPVDNEGTDGKIYCYVCELHVDESSKHCRFCNKCVTRFDHHCKWLNTCVGKKNYRYFLSVVGTVSSLTTISLLLSIAYLVESFAYPDMFIHRVKHAGLNLSSYEAGYIAIASVVVLAPLVLLIYQLCLFHFGLVYYGMTTYEYIIHEQKRLREKDAARVAAAAAKREQKTTPKRATPGKEEAKTHDASASDVENHRSLDHDQTGDQVEMASRNRQEGEKADDEESNDPASEYYATQGDGGSNKYSQIVAGNDGNNEAV